MDFKVRIRSLRKKQCGISVFVFLFGFSIFAQDSFKTKDCIPPCRDGFTCVQGECVESCNPPCAIGEKCDNSGNCVSVQKRSSADDGYSSSDESDMKPTRAIRKNGVSLELPWNGLVGLGLLYTFRPVSEMAVDAGMGLSSMGLKYGIRGRYCFSEKPTSFFCGLGYMAGSGSDNVKTEIENTTIQYDLKPINFIQITGGLDMVSRGGFSALLGIGWAIALNKGLQNVTFEGMSENEYVTAYGAGGVVDSFKKATDLLYNGGLVLFLGVGFAF
jgi:hypothetical protein